MFFTDKPEEVEVTPKQYEDVLNFQEAIMEMIAKNESYHHILNNLCKMAESLFPDTVASIMLLDKETNLLSLKFAPSIPKDSWYMLENIEPSPYNGSCPNALYRNEPQYVINTDTDIRWKDACDIREAFNLRSCWSMPIRDENGNAIGSFALSLFEHKVPSNFHKLFLKTASHIISIVLKNRQNQSRLQLLQDSMQQASEGIIFTDKNNNIIEVNKTFEDIYGYSAKEVIGKNPNILKSGLQNEEFYKKMWDDIEKNGKWSGELINKSKEGRLVNQFMVINKIVNEENEVNYLAIFTDITELRKAQREVDFLLYHDKLTMLYNKLKLNQDILNKAHKISVIHLDINNFSVINLVYGISFADKILRQFAQTIKNKFNATEAYRVNSDEFVLVYEKAVDLKKEIKQIQRYFKTHPFTIDGIVLNISLNIGASYPSKYIFENSSLALKISKEKGKNNYHIFNDKKDIPIKNDKDRFIKANTLIYDAIQKDMFVPYFQKIQSNFGEKKDKYEALVRLEKDSKTISPFEFLEAAKHFGLLTEITKVMISKTFEVMSHNDAEFSINITEDDLNYNYLLRYLKTQAKKYNINHDRVILEILEGLSAKAKEQNLKQLKQLKKEGFKIAIDDFGAEYSNFERLLELDVDYIKIDSKYIRNLDKDPKSYEIVKAISSFSKNMGIKCVAEFVHSKEIYEKVKEIGIEYSQGYYIEKPKKLL